MRFVAIIKRYDKVKWFHVGKVNKIDISKLHFSDFMHNLAEIIFGMLSGRLANDTWFEGEIFQLFIQMFSLTYKPRFTLKLAICDRFKLFGFLFKHFSYIKRVN